MNEAVGSLLATIRQMPRHDRVAILWLLMEELVGQKPDTTPASPPGPTVVPRASDAPSIQTLPRAPRPHLAYDSAGELAGIVNQKSIRVTQSSTRTFRTLIDGVAYLRLTMAIVEEGLNLSVMRKTSGSNSETLARAIFRHLADRYNSGDEEVMHVSA